MMCYTVSDKLIFSAFIYLCALIYAENKYINNGKLYI